MLNVFITNLGKYNEGYLIGEWVKLPATSEELEAVYNRIGINEEYEEIFITDYESEIDGVKVNEFDNIDMLNELAEILNSYEGEDEAEAFGILLDEGYTLEEAVDKMDELRWYYNCEDMTDIAYQIIEESGLLDGVNDTLSRYFDYAAYGRDLGFEGKFFFLNSGNAIELV